MFDVNSGCLVAKGLGMIGGIVLRIRRGFSIRERRMGSGMGSQWIRTKQ